MELEFLLIRVLEATGEDDSGGGVQSKVHIVATVNGRDNESQVLRLRRHGRYWRMPIAQLVEPPIEIAAPVSSWCLVEPAHGEEDLAVTATQLLSNLRSRCSTTDNQDGT